MDRISNRTFNKNEIIEGLKVEALSSDGTGIAKIDGFPVFIKDSLPGDTVTAMITKSKKNLAFARLVSVDEPSPDRVAPRCIKARPCGGCTLQELSYEKQLAFKDDAVYNCLLRIGGIPAKTLDRAHEAPIGMDTPFRYRNKAQYPIARGRDGHLISGFYAGRTHHIIEAKDCYLNPPEFSVILRTFLSFCEEKGIQPYDENTGKGCIRHLVIRKGFETGEIMVMPVVRSLSDLGRSLRDELSEALIGIPGLKTIVINENPEKTNVILGPTLVTLYGPGYICDKMGDLTFRISPLSFYQVNPVQAYKVYQKALEYAALTGAETVYDLCCGIGTISLFLAGSAHFVHGMEVVEEAVSDAVRNAGLNDIKNADFVCAAVENCLPQLEDVHPDVVVMDPPRSGMEKPALDAIAGFSPSRIVYISCDPATLARDLKTFLAAGYRLEKYTVIDQFCQTSHVETVCLMSKVEGK